MITITPDRLYDSVMDILTQYRDATDEVVDHAAKVSASHAVTDLQTGSPRLSGDYGKGWAVKTVSQARVGHLARVVVHNKTEYRLTHLLENGHQKVVYGHRIGGSVPAREHIKPVEEAAQEEFLGLVMQGAANA